jgi:hypothetical protein
MGYTTTKITLTDGKAALRVDGVPGGAQYLRVRVVSAEVTRNGELHDLVVKAQGYAVSSDGIESGEVGPVVGSTEHGQTATDAGVMAVKDLKSRLVRQAVREYLAKRAVTAAAQEFAGDLV